MNIPIDVNQIPDYLRGQSSAILDGYDSTQSQGFDFHYIQKTKEKGFRLVFPDGNKKLLTKVVDGEHYNIKTLPIIIVGANFGTGRAQPRKFYIKPYSDENSVEAPDCQTSNGLTPDAGCKIPQAMECATCKNNWQPNSSEPPKCRNVVYLAVAVLLPDSQHQVLYRLALAASDYINKHEHSLFNYLAGLKAIGVGPENVITSVTYAEGELLRLEFKFGEFLSKDGVSFIREKFLTSEEMPKLLSKDKEPMDKQAFIEHAKQAATPTTQLAPPTPQPQPGKSLEDKVKQALGTPQPANSPVNFHAEHSSTPNAPDTSGARPGPAIATFTAPGKPAPTAGNPFVAAPAPAPAPQGGNGSVPPAPKLSSQPQVQPANTEVPADLAPTLNFLNMDIPEEDIPF